MTTADPYAYLLDERGRVRHEHLDDLLVEVTGGRLLFSPAGREAEVYACRSPTSAETDQARMMYAKRLRQLRQQGLPSRGELEAILLDKGLIDLDARQEKTKLQDTINRLRKSWEITRDPSQKVELMGEIQQMHRRTLEIDGVEFQLFAHSAEAKSEDQRIDFLTSVTVLGGEMLEDRVWPNWDAFQECTDEVLISGGRHAHVRVSAGLPIIIIRALARTQEWRLRWRGAKETNSPPFEGHSSGWDRNKLNLIYWSDFYDSVMQHPESPPIEIIEDDTTLDRWLNDQMAKRESEKASRSQTGGNTVFMRDGSGKRRAMTRMGGKSIQVNQPYRVRTKS